MENPSMENILKNIVNLQMDDSEDEDLKEIKSLFNQIVKEDLKIDSPFEMLTFGLKLAAGDT